MSLHLIPLLDFDEVNGTRRNSGVSSCQTKGNRKPMALFGSTWSICLDACTLEGPEVSSRPWNWTKTKFTLRERKRCICVIKFRDNLLENEYVLKQMPFV